MSEFEDKPVIPNIDIFTKEETILNDPVNENTPFLANENTLDNGLEYTLAKLNKMVKKDLEEILNKKKIKYLSKMLKKDLIELILK